MRSRFLFAVVAALLGASLAAAQSGDAIQPVTYVADFHVKPGMEEQFLKLVREYDQPVFEKLMAEGAVLSWGVDTGVLHRADGPTHSFWWSSPDLAGFDKVFAAFDDLHKKIAEADAKAAEDARKRGQPAPKSVHEKVLETVDMDKRQDYLLRDLVVGHGAVPPAGAQPYLWVSLVRAQPGKREEFRRTWEEYDKPVYDKLAAEGVIYGYSLGIEEARSTDAFTHFVVILMPDLGTREKIREAFRADRQARTPSQRSIITGSFLSAIDPDASREELLRMVIYQTARTK